MTAVRYARSSASDRLVSFTTVISVSGLVLGVAVLVVVLSVMNGFERELRLRILGVLPHGVLYTDGDFSDWQELVQRLMHHPGVAGAAPFLEGGGLVVANRRIAGIRYFGIHPDAEGDVSIIGNFFVEGNLETLQPGLFHVAIGTTLASRLSVKVGDKITLILPDAMITMAGPIPRTKRFVVSGLFEVGSDADKNQILMNIEDGLRLNRKKNVSAIRIATHDLFMAPRVMREIVSVFGDDLFATSWMRRQGNLYDAIQTQKTTMFLLLLMLVAVAAFNLISNLVMIVNDKKPDIAILRTLGATTNEILGIFIVHGVMIGSIGIALGLGLGAFVTHYITEVYAFVDALLNLGLMDEYFIHYLPAEILVNDLLLISFVAFVICFVVTIYPARMAARANPIEVLQHD